MMDTSIDTTNLTVSRTTRQISSNRRNVVIPLLLLGILLISLHPLFSTYPTNAVFKELEEQLRTEKGKINQFLMSTVDPQLDDKAYDKTVFASPEVPATDNVTAISTMDPNHVPVPLEEPEEDLYHAHLGSLSCDRFGGPAANLAQEMVYWRDVLTDMAQFESPFIIKDNEQFLTFETDESGWNNVRMAFETVVGMAIAMGRTLVLPPKLHLSAVWDYGIEKVPVTVFGFEDFFMMNVTGLKVISFQEFLERVALEGKFIDINTGKPTFPPNNNLTNWNGLLKNYESTRGGTTKVLYEWLRNVSTPLLWDYNSCVAAFPATRGEEGTIRLQGMLHQILQEENRSNVLSWQRVNSFTNKPTPVNASAIERLREILTDRKELCSYDDKYQQAHVIHVYGEQRSGYRMLVHFYAFLFIEDWQLDLYVKRFIRDRIRYIDQLHCAAARIVNKVRQIARESNGEKSDGTFDSFHIRRNDFKQAYKDVVLSAEEIYVNNTSPVIREKRTVYVATDEKDLSFFLPLREHYNLVFMNDFMDEIKDIIPNFYGLIDELVSARGETFVGTFYSTFSGYINRLRGYFADRDDGSINSYYSVPAHLAYNRDIMTKYTGISAPYWAREFPVCWRDIDHGLERINATAKLKA